MYICTYVCMYVFMYVWPMYVCIYVCIYVYVCMYVLCMYIRVCVYLCIYEYVYVYMYVFMYVCLCMYVCMYACMYVCMYILITFGATWSTLAPPLSNIQLLHVNQPTGRKRKCLIQVYTAKIYLICKNTQPKFESSNYDSELPCFQASVSTHLFSAAGY